MKRQTYWVKTGDTNSKEIAENTKQNKERKFLLRRAATSTKIWSAFRRHEIQQTEQRLDK